MKTWIPRNLRDDGMVEDLIGEHHPLTKYVTLDDMNKTLAEKDREISQLTQSIEMLRYALQGSQDQYQQLMEKAVRFARWIYEEDNDNEEVKRLLIRNKTFLKERT